jgi:hypothetical protein
MFTLKWSSAVPTIEKLAFAKVGSCNLGWVLLGGIDTAEGSNDETSRDVVRGEAEDCEEPNVLPDAYIQRSCAVLHCIHVERVLSHYKKNIELARRYSVIWRRVTCVNVRLISWS